MKYNGPVHRNDKGEVAVLVSHGFGGGWYTWGNVVDQMFSPNLVQAVLTGTQDDRLRVAQEQFPDQYDGGVYQLCVEWVQEGQPFRINEYDGAESLELLNVDDNYFVV